MPMGSASRARKEARFKADTWHLQEITTTSVPNQFPPPNFITAPRWGDGRIIAGFHTPDLSNEARELFPSGTGSFTVKAGEPVKMGDVLRSERENIYIKLTTEPTVVYDFSKNQVQRYRYELVDRAGAESETRRFGF